jgi:hypothetical protein
MVVVKVVRVVELRLVMEEMAVQAGVVAFQAPAGVMAGLVTLHQQHHLKGIMEGLLR